MLGELAAIQRIDGRIAAARDLPGGLRAEIGHHGHTVAVARQQVVHAVVHAHVRHVVEREGDVAGPNMGDADAIELREAVDHVLVERGRAHLGGRRGEAGAAAENQPLAVRRGPVIGEHALGVADRPHPGDQHLVGRLRQVLGGDDVARDRHDAAHQPWRQVAGIAVGRDHDFLGDDRSLGRQDAPAIGYLLAALGLDIGAQHGARLVRRLEQALVVERGMQMAGAARIHAAVVIVRLDVVLLLAPRHHRGAGIGVFVVGLDLGGEVVVVALRPGADEAAVPVQTALDLLAGDDVLEHGEGVGAGAHQLGLVALELVGDRALATQSLAEVGAARDHAAV
ncbi:MAG TPA: hypothetical protein VEC14_08490, partial [Reyranellaceae bacterium]|nr:hypothetical protein [Reyranellaceae bacterium]